MNEFIEESINMHTKILDVEKLVISNLSTEEDIKEWLSISLEEYIFDGDINSFVRALEYALKAKDSISGISKKTGISRSNLYAIFKGEVTPQLNTIAKILKELGYTLRVA